MPWPEIDRFDIVNKRGYDASRMYLRDGTFVDPKALSGPWGKGKEVPRAVAGLNTELAQYRPADPTPQNSMNLVETADQLTLPTS